MNGILKLRILFKSGIFVFLSFLVAGSSTKQNLQIAIKPLDATKTPEIFLIETPSPLATLPPTPISEDISKALLVECIGPFSIKITNFSLLSPLKVSRRFISDSETIVDLLPQETYIDNVTWDGTQYFYLGEDEWGNKTDEVEVTSEIDKVTLERGLFYSWEQSAKQNGVPNRIITIESSSTMYAYQIHGVSVELIYEKAVADSFTEAQMEGYFIEAVWFFHRHWQLYGGFPYDEFRITCWDSENVIFENALGFQVPFSFLQISMQQVLAHSGEALSHGVGHAWIGDAITFDNGWIWEGFEHYNGIITLPTRSNFLIRDLNDGRFTRHVNEPLNTMYANLFRTPDDYAYYAKGGFLAHKISTRLIDETESNYEQFLRYLYDKYYMTQNGREYSKHTSGYLSTGVLLSELNTFSGLDFTDMFDKYVYGVEDITIGLQIDERYLPIFAEPLY